MDNEEALNRFKAILAECSMWCEENKLTEMFGMAISALEKQIPKKPIWHRFFEDGEDYSYFKCPNGCKYGALTSTDGYCRTCGQAIDWRSDDE